MADLKRQIVTSNAGPNLKSQIASSSFTHWGRRKLPIAFTEHGALMAANILNSPRAVAVSVYVIRAFVKMREDVAADFLIGAHTEAAGMRPVTRDPDLSPR
jgi:hypothetical protein